MLHIGFRHNVEPKRAATRREEEEPTRKQTKRKSLEGECPSSNRLELLLEAQGQEAWL